MMGGDVSPGARRGHVSEARFAVKKLIIGVVTVAFVALGLTAPASATPSLTSTATKHSVTATLSTTGTMLGGQMWNTVVELVTTTQGAILRTTSSYAYFDGSMWVRAPDRVTEVTSGFMYSIDRVNLSAASVNGTDLPGTQCSIQADGSRTDCTAVTQSVDLAWSSQGAAVTEEAWYSRIEGCHVTKHHVTTVTRDADVTGTLEPRPSGPYGIWWGHLVDTTDQQASVCITKPSAPRSVAASPRNRAAVVTWAAPDTDGEGAVTRYTVLASPSGRTCVTSGTARSCTVTGLVNRTAYRFTVRASNPVGTGPASTPSGWIVAGTPTQLRSLAVTYPWVGAARMTWTSPAYVGSGPVTTYQIRWSYNRGATWTPWVNRWLQHFATRTHLARGHTYLVQVRARNGSGAAPVATRVFIQAR